MYDVCIYGSVAHERALQFANFATAKRGILAPDDDAKLGNRNCTGSQPLPEYYLEVSRTCDDQSLVSPVNATIAFLRAIGGDHGRGVLYLARDRGLDSR